MSRFVVTSGSHFEPFSYDDIVKPLQQQTDVHNATQDAYEQLSMETAALGRYISRNPEDSRAREMYDNYMNKLSAFQENLYNNGISAATRRDLSSARAAYASDITRLQAAIKSRQERSKEYWDARHKNPDLVMGFDPATGGLDNYLDNDNYGQDWYSYSGTQFASEVGTEAKARAAELKQVVAGRNPQLEGYLEYIERNGFSNNDVNGAAILAREILSGKISPDNPNIDPIQGMLAGVLLNRIQATGAKSGQNLSEEEFDRLVEYGILGLSQGIGETNISHMSDKVWDEAAARRRIDYQIRANEESQKRMKAWEADLAQRQQALEGRTAHRENISMILDPDAKDEEYARRKLYGKNFESRIITLPTDEKFGIEEGTFEIDKEADILSIPMPVHTRKFYESTGIDIRIPVSFWNTKESKQEGRYTDPNGKTVQLQMQRANIWQQWKYGLNPGSVIVRKSVNGRWEYDEQMTANANRARDEFKEYSSQISEANPGFSISGKAKDFRDVRKRFDIPSDVPDQYLPYVIDLKDPSGEHIGIPLAGVGEEDDSTKGRYAESITAMYAEKGNDYFKTGRNGFYKVGNDMKTIATKASGLEEVFEMNGTSVDPKSIKRIGVFPMDITTDGMGNPKVMVRITTTKGQFITDISTFGDDAANGFNPYTSDVIATLMLPITKPELFMSRRPMDDYKWRVYAAYLNKDFDAGLAVEDKDESGKSIIRTVTAQEVIMDERLQKYLLNAINEYIKYPVANAIGPNLMNHMQSIGNTSANPKPII